MYYSDYVPSQCHDLESRIIKVSHIRDTACIQKEASTAESGNRTNSCSFGGGASAAAKSQLVKVSQ